MSVSLDCRDGKHRACASCGGCCCECHEIMHLTAEPTLTEAEQVQLAKDWALLVWEWPEPTRKPEGRRIRARHAAQPRGFRRLMSSAPATWLRWAAIVVVGLGSGAIVPLLAIAVAR